MPPARTNAISVLYLDTSALAKLVQDEAESATLKLFLAPSSEWSTSEIAIVELLRFANRNGPGALAGARRVLDGVSLIAAARDLLDLAAILEPGTLRSLDAIHLASALTLGDELEAVVTYDRRMQGAAESLGIRVEAPGQQP